MDFQKKKMNYEKCLELISKNCTIILPWQREYVVYLVIMAKQQNENATLQGPTKMLQVRG
jgi:hypothetical protein